MTIKISDLHFPQSFRNLSFQQFVMTMKVHFTALDFQQSDCSDKKVCVRYLDKLNLVKAVWFQPFRLSIAPTAINMQLASKGVKKESKIIKWLILTKLVTNKHTHTLFASFCLLTTFFCNMFSIWPHFRLLLNNYYLKFLEHGKKIFTMHLIKLTSPHTI